MALRGAGEYLRAPGRSGGIEGGGGLGFFISMVTSSIKKNRRELRINNKGNQKNSVVDRYLGHTHWGWK